jgi:hypothetical protein
MSNIRQDWCFKCTLVTDHIYDAVESALSCTICNTRKISRDSSDIQALRIEQKVANKYRAEGWTVLTKGAPDLFMFRQNSHGDLEIKFVEVKGRGDMLSPEQRIYLNTLHKYGLPAKTFWVRYKSESEGGTTYKETEKVLKNTRELERKLKESENNYTTAKTAKPEIELKWCKENKNWYEEVVIDGKTRRKYKRYV